MTEKLYFHFEKIFIHSWWMLLFFLVCYYCYEQGLQRRNQDFQQLNNQYVALKEEKISAQLQQENLLLQINSQSDPEWIELTLMKGLGLVGEEQTKVLFTD